MTADTGAYSYLLSGETVISPSRLPAASVDADRCRRGNTGGGFREEPHVSLLNLGLTIIIFMIMINSSGLQQRLLATARGPRSNKLNATFSPFPRLSKSK